MNGSGGHTNEDGYITLRRALTSGFSEAQINRPGVIDARAFER